MLAQPFNAAQTKSAPCPVPRALAERLTSSSDCTFAGI
jgi:hypothetical protein